MGAKDIVLLPLTELRDAVITGLVLYYPHYKTSGLPAPRQLLVHKQPGGTRIVLSCLTMPL